MDKVQVTLTIEANRLTELQAWLIGSKQVAAKQTTKKAKEPVKPKAEAPVEESNELTLGDLQELTKEKAQAHRAEIIEELKRLGAEGGVSSLDGAKYSEYANFLSGLK